MSSSRVPKKSLKFTEKEKAAWLGRIMTDDMFSQKDVMIVVEIAEMTVYDEINKKSIAKRSSGHVHRQLKTKCTQSHVNCVYQKLQRLGYIRGTKKSTSQFYYFMDSKH